MPAAPALNAPPGACDTHTHVLGPYDRFPPVHPQSYALPLAPVTRHLEMLNAVGLDRGVIVQPSFHDVDNSAIVDALRHSAGRLRGIGALRPDATDEELLTLHAAGVRGLRFTEVLAPDGRRRPGAIGIGDLVSLAPRMRNLAWHAHLWSPPAAVIEHQQMLRSLNLPIVLDHMGMIDVRRGVADSGFLQLVQGLREGWLWIKLTVCRCSVAAPTYGDLRPFHDALVQANPARLLWGSDWPFIRMDERAPDAGALFNLFCEWVGDPALVRLISATNPASLFGFE